VSLAKQHCQELLAKARRSVKAARSLLEEGHLDFAVSRAYYGMFYAAEAMLLAKGLAFSRHQGVVGAFGREFAKTGEIDKEHHARLVQAFQRRQLADYQASVELTCAQADQTLQWAEAFISMAEDWLRKAGLL
jgi:uncharacterized protein (UPF0332 family)